MKKQGPSCTTRKPPEPSDSHAEIDDWMNRAMPDLQPIVKHLDKQIRDSIDGLQYAVMWTKGYYGVPKRSWIIEVVAYYVLVNLVFLGGAGFSDPPPLGSGTSRYVKVKTLDEAKAPEIGEWIREAARVPGWM